MDLAKQFSTPWVSYTSAEEHPKYLSEGRRLQTQWEHWEFFFSDYACVIQWITSSFETSSRTPFFFRLNMKFSFCDKEGKGATCIYLVREDNKSVGTLKKFRKRSEQRDLFKRLSRKLYSKFMEQLQLRKRISKQWKRNKCIQSFVLTRTFQKWDFSYLIFRPQEGIWQWSNGRMKQCI